MDTFPFEPKFLAEKLGEGSLALFPTDTLPALASAPSYSEKLWRIKKRSLKKPLILMGANKEQLLDLVLPIALEDASEFAHKYWPGSLTLVLPALGSMVNLLNPEGEKIGLRVPACEMARELLSKSGPLATTSANISGSKPSLSVKEASKYFPGIPLLGPLPWPISSGLASTVVVWKNTGDWEVLREGAVMPKEIN